MRIALDATYAVGKQLTGVGIYCRRILDGLAASSYPQHHYIHCYRPHRLRYALGQAVPQSVRRSLLLDQWRPRADLFHGLNQRLPRNPGRAITTFHDLFVMTEQFSAPAFRERFAQLARDAAERSEHIICVSQFTADQVRDVLGIEAARLSVIPHGVDLPPEVPPFATREPATFLHVGSLQARKNIVRLLNAFADLCRKTTSANPRLVLCGGWGYRAEDIQRHLQEMPFRERVQVIGYASQADVAQWYSRSTALVFPSLGEGFGIPVLEAMAHGLPVLCSRTTALPEAAGAAAMYVDPQQTDEISEGMSRLLENQELREKMSRAGRRRAEEFPWSRAVQSTYALYRRLLR